MVHGERIAGTTFATPTDREVVATRIFDAPRSVVWDAFTNPKHRVHWMLGPEEGWTLPVCEVDLRPGGAWRHVWRLPGGGELEMRGVFREVQPPERLVHTEAWGGDWPETQNILILTPADLHTATTSTVVFPSSEARDRALATGMCRGWAASHRRLDEYLKHLV